jgi:TPP-dependent trihydroxycyclohexane-1,2-dione (THcHDO) dehydratase
MKKLSKEHLKERDEIAAKLTTAQDELQSSVSTYNDTRLEKWEELAVAVVEFNAALEDAWSEVADAQTAFNEVLADANAWKRRVSEEIGEYMDARSEKWQESDAAENYREWREAFEEEITESELEQPEPIEVAEPDELALDIDEACELLEQCPEELPGS